MTAVSASAPAWLSDAFMTTRPKSLTTLVAIALVIVTLPMLGAVVVSVWNAERQLAESRALVDRAVRVTTLGGSVDDQVGLLERTARRLGERGAAADQARFHERQDKLIGVLDDMTAEQPAAKPRRIVRELKSLAQAPIDEAQPLPLSESAQAAQKKTFTEMRELADDIQSANRRALSDRLSELAALNAKTRRGLLLGSALMVMVAVVLIGVMAQLIGRPLQQLVSGIRRLGRSDLNQPIAVSGTAELRALGRELDWLRERLRTVEEDKHAFLRQVAHDLKTPLTNIKEGGALLYEGIATPERHGDIVRIIHRNAGRLEALLLQLFDFTASQQALPDPEFVPCDLGDIVSRCLLEQELQFNARGICVEADMAPQLDLPGDPERLAALVDNLISNAIKFSPPGGVVRIAGWHARDQLCLSVRDEGPGFTSEERVRAFDPFFRGARAIAEDVPGTGIGLSVARQCARLHGGGIEIVQEADGGHLQVTLARIRKEN